MHPDTNLSSPQRAGQRKYGRFVIDIHDIPFTGSVHAGFQAQADGTVLVKAKDASIRRKDLFLRKDPREPPWDLITISILGIESLMPVSSFGAAVLVLHRDYQLVVGVARTSRLAPCREANSFNCILFASRVGMDKKRNARIRLIVIGKVLLEDATGMDSRGQKGHVECKELHTDSRL
jgi:hypothetical protein